MSTPVPDSSPLDTYQSAEDVLLLDVREDDEWAAGHAPSAQHMALSRLDPSALNRATPIIVICRSGNRSGKAAARLAEAGFTVWNMTGGMNEWQKLGLPVQTDDDSPDQSREPHWGARIALSLGVDCAKPWRAGHCLASSTSPRPMGVWPGRAAPTHNTGDTDMALLRPSPGPARRISPAYAVRRYRAGEAVILDVREQAEYAAGHAPDAVPLPPRGLTAQVSLPQEVRGRPVLCACRSGNRSQQAAEILTAGGVTALNVAGGMRAWAHAGLPVHTDQGREGQVV